MLNWFLFQESNQSQESNSDALSAWISKIYIPYWKYTVQLELEGIFTEGNFA